MEVLNNNYQRYKLENGLIVSLQNTPTQTVAAELDINYGEVHEKKGEEGIAHFLEHVLYSGGTEKYPPEKVIEIFEGFGKSNATTSVNKTFFQGDMLEEDLELYLELISSIVFTPKFDKEKIMGTLGLLEN